MKDITLEQLLSDTEKTAWLTLEDVSEIQDWQQNYLHWKMMLKQISLLSNECQVMRKKLLKALMYNTFDNNFVIIYEKK
ncbi:Protein of unknown function, partial [Gryllus bimaculatus]